MKKISTLILLIFSICGYSQNRYSEVSTSDYKPIEYDVYKDYYKSKSEKENKIIVLRIIPTWTHENAKKILDTYLQLL